MKFLFDFFPSLETDSLSLSILFSTTTIDDKREYDTRDGFRKRITRVNGISPDDARGTRVVLFRWPPRVISVATSRPLSRLTSQGRGSSSRRGSQKEGLFVTAEVSAIPVRNSTKARKY